MEQSLNLYNFLNTLCEVSQDDFERSKTYFKQKTLKKGEVWVDFGEICNEMAYINSGLLQSSYINDRGNIITTCFCSSNSMASSFKSFISQSQSDIELKAIENTELMITDYEKLQSLYQEIPVWERIGRILVEKEFISLWNYANSLNSDKAKQRYLRLLENQPEVITKAPVQDIASYLGITRETLSRIRKKLIQ
ncbi:Crp/Fnr family transcriptional regulator [Zobellia galactanivorans]|uniref:Crp/Fnr family transcriptional regulator n=1 Tax=Zobellia galactanivorans (strain DSM 12802 / CCUG 47099 / CIP 106680 / NCIMB 13871 / Dsij) TaxID=63186 RepID=UPI0026E47BCC|nr:Crp/Fnr family transcriptional regulator [Zobellia galactanivorans]MDO6810912.1 Crp/Fnr family transcriptional regulator [Zobellia galactanivorans]